MRPGTARILACPNCRGWLRCQALDWTRRTGVTVWSDLRVEHSFWQTPSRIASCPNCGEAFRKDAALNVGVLPSSAEELIYYNARTTSWRQWLPVGGRTDALERYRNAKPAEALTQAQIDAALNTDPQHDELELRLQLWRHHNDARRRHPQQDKLPPDVKANVERLLSLLHPREAIDHLLGAELNRQLGRFHAAMLNLSHVRQSLGREKAAMMSWVIEGSSGLRVYY